MVILGIGNCLPTGIAKNACMIVHVEPAAKEGILLTVAIALCKTQIRPTGTQMNGSHYRDLQVEVLHC